jgi:coenzyme F420-reducing hydrogenase alpha subunit
MGVADAPGTSRGSSALRQQREHHRDQLDPQVLRLSVNRCKLVHLKSPYYSPLGFPDGMYRVGPLARLNVAEQMGTPKPMPS